jgi:hypothetical protein
MCFRSDNSGSDVGSFSVEMDGLQYQKDSGHICCVLPGLVFHAFPRNRIAVNGGFFRVQKLRPSEKIPRFSLYNFGLDPALLESICLPSSNEILPEKCFSGFLSLSTVAFEPGSSISQIEASLFEGCVSLSSICIPSSVQILCQHCFAACAEFRL